jgi:AcrR family transcriptional regulator
MSADERREAVVRAAIVEFARGGYAGTSTGAIARRVGVSQPYLFRLFPDKRAIFLAAARRCTDDIRRCFEEAVRGVGPDAAEGAMRAAYLELVRDRDGLMFQMQMYVAVHTAGLAGDHAFGEAVRTVWLELWDSVRLLLGADADRVRHFIGDGMLINVLLCLGFTDRQGHVWRSGGFEVPPGAFDVP